jgi:hypothetical protein
MFRETFGHFCDSNSCKPHVHAGCSKSQVMRQFCIHNTGNLAPKNKATKQQSNNNDIECVVAAS